MTWSGSEFQHVDWDVVFGNLNRAFASSTSSTRNFFFLVSPLYLPDTQSPLERLCELAGMPFSEGVDQRRVYRKALRVCHPDSGGSHEAFVELQDIARKLGIIK